MPSHGGAPGKTAPRLLHDFQHFDPLKASATSNYLTDCSPPKDEGVPITPGIGSCRHEYATKPSQSVLPPLDLRPDGGTEYKTAVICKKCRLHADIHISFATATATSATTASPCPNADYPLHHFQRVPARDERLHDRIVYGWQCSAPECNAHLNITFRRARLDSEQKRLLTNTDFLKRRYEAILRDQPTREGTRQATPIEALSRLRKYIKDALNPEHARRTFPANNKRFMEAFGFNGQDCGHLLQELGFQQSTDEDGCAQWSLPDPPPVSNRLRADGTSARERLEDVEMELLAHMYQVSAETGAINPASSEIWKAAGNDIERTLAVQGYHRHPAARRATTPSEQLPYFESLGILPDFADSLVEFAFDRQSACDPERRHYYFECLQALASYRGTEQLHMKVATLASYGLVSRREVAAACKQLGLQYSEAIDASEDRILNVFYAQQADQGQQGQEDSRQALDKLGSFRGSQRLINASRQMIETYDEALEWLGSGATKDTPNDTLIAIAVSKMAEGNEEMAQKAISVIAKELKSEYLNNWLLTGRTDGGGYQMSVDEALRHLAIDQSLDALDPSVLPSVFDNARIDRPGEQTDKAIATIEQALAGTTATWSPDSWPVGLTSHGNTCYLNSLLQYYFSIAPLREIILNYDQYKLDTDTYAEKEERVGQRQISQVEIKGGQRFADDLKHLFERMIKEPGKDVKPEEDLVCRAFLEPKDYALLASAIKEDKIAQGGHPKTISLEDAVDETVADDSAFSKVSRQESDASSVTLQGSLEGDEDVQMLEPPLESQTQNGEDTEEKEKPTTAPPLPPRRFSTTKEEALEKAQANARQQQDVTEVHDAIQFRLRSGMKPEGKDAWGEQEDVLRRLFKIDLVETSVKDDVDSKQKELPDSSLQLNVPYEKTDIYSALDAYFDLQAGITEGSEQYKSIRSLPPLLQVNIPRIGYDKDGRGTFKTEATIKLEDELYLDRYVDTSDPRVLPTRRSCWGWRKELHALRKEQTALSRTAIDLDGPTAVSETANYVKSLSSLDEDFVSIGMDGVEVDPTLPEALDADAVDQNKRLAALDTKIAELEQRLKDQFSDMKQLKYRLAAVFFHRGTYGHGHYWIYIHDFDKDIWRVYNDERVEQFNKINEILEAEGWSQGTPTYAVYVQDSKKSEMIQPVCRDPERAATPEPSEMTNTAWGDDAHANGGSADLPPLIPAYPAKKTTIESEASWDTPRIVPSSSAW